MRSSNHLFPTVPGSRFSKCISGHPQKPLSAPPSKLTVSCLPFSKQCVIFLLAGTHSPRTCSPIGAHLPWASTSSATGASTWAARLYAYRFEAPGSRIGSRTFFFRWAPISHSLSFALPSLPARY